MSAPPSLQASPQSALRRSKEEPALSPLDPSAPQKIGMIVPPEIDPLDAYADYDLASYSVGL